MIRILHFSHSMRRDDGIDTALNPRNQMCFIVFDEFVLNTKSVYEEILHFLSISKDAKDEFPRLNENKVTRINWLGNLITNPPKNLLGARFFAEKLNFK